MNFNFQEFIKEYKQRLADVFSTEEEKHEDSLVRGIKPATFNQIMELAPLGAFIPSKYDGFGGHTSEALSMLEASSYESLPLSLMMGINGALFLQPVANYGSEEAKTGIYDRVMHDRRMGGLMITEPDYGSDALKMQTSFTKEGGKYKIEGLKHWAGLTGMADYWLMTARGKDKNGKYNMNEIQRLANKFIDKNYEFMGYEKFVNKISNFEIDVLKKNPETKKYHTFFIMLASSLAV